MFDSHCHLDFPALDADRDRLLEGAKRLGVSGWMVPGVSLETWHRQDALRRIADVVFGAGIHPYFGAPGREPEEAVDQLRRRAQELEAVAIGEFGLDKKKRGAAEFSVQVELFEAQLRLAKELDLPVVLHQVGAREEFLAGLKRVGLSSAGGVVHGFTGDETWALSLVRRGLYLGVGPAVLRRERRKLRAALRAVPGDRLLVETDAPDQAPPGVDRGTPADVALVIEELATIREQPAERIARLSEDNARGLFRLSRPSHGAPSDLSRR